LTQLWHGSAWRGAAQHGITRHSMVTIAGWTVPWSRQSRAWHKYEAQLASVSTMQRLDCNGRISDVTAGPSAKDSIEKPNGAAARMQATSRKAVFASFPCSVVYQVKLSGVGSGTRCPQARDPSTLRQNEGLIGTGRTGHLHGCSRSPKYRTAKGTDWFHVVLKKGNHTILITGGASGIGFGLATRLADLGIHVVVTGRRADKLSEATTLCPALKAVQGDVSSEEGRRALHAKVMQAFPRLNVLINNAGIQHRLPPLATADHGAAEVWAQHELELSTNLDGPMHLSFLFLPHLLAQPEARIVNVSSGLAFVPMAAMPTYCSSKAALHSFTLSLRRQLEDTSVKVTEVIPPAVDTDLGGVGLHKCGEPLDAFSDHVVAIMVQDEEPDEIGYNMSDKMRAIGLEGFQGEFKAIHSRH
jgi:uncharacterized oxidoreductase